MKTFTKYALLGSGRVARHLQFYLQSLNLPVVTWSRSSGRDLSETLEGASHVLLAISDRALAEFPPDGERVYVHFSGGARIPGVFAAHPLMTFGEKPEELDWYPSIPFVIDEGTKFEEILPGLPNPHYALPADQRPLYHALCSLAGNSTFLLWKQIGDEFEQTLKLPRGLLSPFLHQVVSNSSRHNPMNFTGPVARGDWPTVSSHLKSLIERPDLLHAYQGYLNLAQETGYAVPSTLREVQP